MHHFINVDEASPLRVFLEGKVLLPQRAQRPCSEFTMWRRKIFRLYNRFYFYEGVKLNIQSEDASATLFKYTNF